MYIYMSLCKESAGRLTDQEIVAPDIFVDRPTATRFRAYVTRADALEAKEIIEVALASRGIEAVFTLSMNKNMCGTGFHWIMSYHCLDIDADRFALIRPTPEN